MGGILWKKITIRVPARMEESVSDYLVTLTGRGVSSRDEEGDILIDAFLDGAGWEHLGAIEGFLADLRAHGDLSPGTRAEVADLPEEDWMSVFRSQHHPVRISERLVVRPAWCGPVGSADIVLDPGMAFGTGSHATTRMCLEFLDEVARDRNLGRMLDLGTGSGILAIAGASLGASEVLAVDIDPVAVSVAGKNVRANGFEAVVRVEEGGVERSDGLFDVVTANLTGRLLENLAREIAGLAALSGHLILSGIMTGELEKLFDAYSRTGLEPVREKREDIWRAALLRRPG